MSDDYLWDRSGEVDPEIERLEQLLGRLRSAAPMPDVSSTGGAEPTPIAYVGVRFLAPALAAAAVIVMMVAAARYAADAQPSWRIARITGTPRIGSRPIDGAGRLAVGQVLATDAVSSARVEVGDIGELAIGSDSRVRLVQTRGSHRLALDRGSLHAIISAPPGQFVVDTPSATAIDLGCVYSLRVYEDGAGQLSVQAGWVAFEDKGRESFVPAGASSRLDPSRGPGTPTYDDADVALQRAIDIVDTARDEGQRRDALRTVLERARERDAMTLWHLIPRIDAADRGAVLDELARRVTAPPGVPRDAAIRLDRAALDAWWNALGLLDTTWWRTWKRPLAGVTPP